MSLAELPRRIAYNIEEAMFASGLSRRTLDRAMASGQLPSAFVAGRRRISPAALERFMAGLPPDPNTAPRMKSIAVAAR